MLQFPLLSRNCNIFHFVTTRNGGVGVGEFESFNLGEFTEDQPETWRKNRSILCEAIGIETSQLFVPFQTHEDHILDIDSRFMDLTSGERKKQLEGVDALVTSLPRVCVAVTTADCVPVLLYAPDKQVVAAIHAGWRSTVKNIAAKTIRYMKDQYQCDLKQILVGIGPSICAEAFEVGEEVAEAFSPFIKTMTDVSFVNEASGKTHLDLSRINRNLMCKEGISEENVVLSGLCTFREKNHFFSARRQGIRSGRMLTGIMINE